jgi:hypothetical protein
MSSVYSSVFFILCVSIPFLATAHSNGASLEQTVGAYTIDIGHDPATLEEYTRAVFDLNLLHIDGTRVEYTHAWVRIAEGESTVFATNIAHASLGPTTIVWVPPFSGDMTLYVRFEDEEKVLAEHTFTIPVSSSQEGTWVNTDWSLLLGICGALAIGFAVFLWRRKAGV